MICPYCQCPMELWTSDTDEYDTNPYTVEIEGETVEVYSWNCPECEYAEETYDA